jgi:hypothetical protein
VPTYQFQNPKTSEIKEISLGMNDPKVYSSADGTKWERLFLPVNLKPNSGKSLSMKEQLKGGGVRYITDKMAKDKGLKNADEYIDAHNEIQAEHAKILPPSKQKIIP